MNQLKTQAIVLRRTDYGEADRIVIVLTPDQGKLHLMAKGARRIRSKLAGGIELFSVSELSFVPGRGALSTLVSAKLLTHYAAIAKDIDRTMLGYELIKRLHKVTEDEAGPEYFTLLKCTLVLLASSTISLSFVETWFSAQLLRLAGHMPNLITDREGKRLVADDVYAFDFEAVCFYLAAEGREDAMSTEEIKYLRLLFSEISPEQIARVDKSEQYTNRLMSLVMTLWQFYLN